MLVPPAHEAPLPSAQRRLQTTLLAELARADHAKGLGLEGPVVRAVADLVRESDLARVTTARLLVVSILRGRVQSVSVLYGDSDAAEWRRITERLKKALAGRAAPAGGQHRRPTSSSP